MAQPCPPQGKFLRALLVMVPAQNHPHPGVVQGIQDNGPGTLRCMNEGVLILLSRISARFPRDVQEVILPPLDF
jgi:hypothetical protein